MIFVNGCKSIRVRKRAVYLPSSFHELEYNFTSLHLIIKMDLDWKWQTFAVCFSSSGSSNSNTTHTYNNNNIQS